MNRDDEYFRLIALQRKLSDALQEVRAQMNAIGPPLHRPYRIALRPDERGEDPMDHRTALDDIVVRAVPMFRAEQMDRNHWWVCCYLDDDAGDRICWNVSARSKPLRIEWTGYEYPESCTAYEHELGAP